MKNLLFLRGLAVTILFGENAAGSTHSVMSPAFAGGFGGSKTSKSKRTKRKRGLSEIAAPTPTPQIVQKNDGPKLDKWGLPVATVDDIFPPMPPGTVLIPVDSNKRTSLEEIQDCLKDHIDLRLERLFDQDGFQRDHDKVQLPMKLKLLHKSPPVLCIENFFTEEECRSMQEATKNAHEVNSATFTGALSTRTSTSWFCHFKDVPALLAKANWALSIPLETMEEPQVVRYRKGQEFSWHYDEVPSPQLGNGGQRLATLLVYLTDVAEECGGGTAFRDLTMDGEPLVMNPKKGSALLFFPAFRDGRPDDRTLHRSEAMVCDTEKWIVQMWVHQQAYSAVLPEGNSNEAARNIMEDTLHQFGFK